MTFKVKRILLKKTLETERAQLQKAHEKELERYEKESEAYPEIVLRQIDKLKAQVLKGNIPVNRYGDVSCGLSKAPVKPKPDCRIADINEMLRLLNLSDEEHFSLNDSSKFYQYACRLGDKR